MEINQRERSAETAAQLMKAFGIKSAYSMWPNLSDLLKEATVRAEKTRFMNLTELGIPCDHEGYHIHDEEVIDAEFDVAEDFWEELDLEED